MKFFMNATLCDNQMKSDTIESLIRVRIRSMPEKHRKGRHNEMTAGDTNYTHKKNTQRECEKSFRSALGCFDWF